MLFTREEYDAEIKRWNNRIVATCKKCGGVGSINKEGTNKDIMCDCQEKAILYSQLVCNGVPRKYLDEKWNWSNLNNNIESISKVKNYSENFVNKYMDGLGLYIYGRQGRGKSLLESLLLRDVAKMINPDTGKVFKVVFIIFENLVKMSHDSRSDKMVSYKMNGIINNCDLLVIDNIGSETGTAAYHTKFLEMILRTRDNNCLPTIISSNYTPEQINEHYSDTVHDFIKQNCEMVFVEGDNYRQKSDVGATDIEDILGIDF